MNIERSLWRMIGAWLLVVAAGEAAWAHPGALGWTIERRSDRFAAGGRTIDYHLKWQGARPVRLAAADVGVTLRGWVSNAKVPGHEVPRISSLRARGAGAEVTGDLIAADDPAARCRERFQILLPDVPDGKAIVLAPGGRLRLSLVLEHIHFLHGPYDPLLGTRFVSIRLGPARLGDRLDLDAVPLRLAASCPLEQPPDDRLDPNHYVTAPHSLHLEAHVPGCQYYRYRDQEVRYDSPMRLSFWYLVAHGTQGKSKARVAQYRDGPGSSWKVLPEGAFEVPLDTVGRWTRVERTFRTQAEATTLGLDFRISGSDVGEVWIDDVRLEPIGEVIAGP